MRHKKEKIIQNIFYTIDELGLLKRRYIHIISHTKSITFEQYTSASRPSVGFNEKMLKTNPSPNTTIAILK